MTSRNELSGRSGDFVRTLGGAAFAAIGARTAQLVMAAMLAWQFGPAGFGQVAFALAVGALAGQFGALGWPALSVRLTARYAQADPARLRLLMKTGARRAALGGGAAGLVLVVLAIGAALGGAGMSAEGLAMAALIAPTAALRRLAQSQLSALFRPAAGLALEDLPGPAAVLLWSAAFGLSGPLAALSVFAGAAAAAAFAGLRLARRTARLMQARAEAPCPQRVAALSASDAPAAWPGAARALLAGAAPRMLLGRADMLMIAPLLGFEAAGLYAAALRIAYVVTAPPLLLAQAMQPFLSLAYHRGEMDRLRRRLTLALGAIGAWAGLAAGVAVIFADGAARALGAGFAPAAGLLPALALAEGATALGAPLVVLAISGPGFRLLGRAGMALAGSHAVLLMWLAPQRGAGWGVEGAAWLHCGLSAALALAAAAAAAMALREAGGRAVRAEHRASPVQAPS